MSQSIIERLAACAATWHGTSTLQDPGRLAPETTASTLHVTPVLGGRFVRLDYTWSYQGAPQEGSLLVGFVPEEKTVSAHWIDTWHMSRKVMALTGAEASEEMVDVRGSYAAPPGPDWGWRISIAIHPQALRLLMFNIWPDAKREDLAVEARYARLPEG